MSQDDKNLIDQGWRRKYSDTLYELERQQRKWSHSETLLRRFISKLSLSIESDSAQLTQQFEKLRETIQSGADTQALRELVEDISTRLTEIEKGRGMRKGDDATCLALLSLLDAIDLPAGVKPRAEKLRAGLMLAKSGDGPRYVKEFQVFLSQIVSSEAPANANTRGLWARLFAPGEFAETVSPSDDKAVVQSILHYLVKHLAGMFDESMLTVWQQRINTATRREDYLAVLDNVIEMLRKRPSGSGGARFSVPGELIYEVLTGLIDSISLPDNLISEVESIRSQLASQVKTQQAQPFLGTLRGLADLLGRACKQLLREREELEEFLQQLNQRLSTLDSDLKESVELRLTSLKEGVEWGARMHEELRELDTTTQQSTDLPTLKSAVQGHIRTLENTVNNFREREEVRNTQSLNLIKHLSHEIYRLEKEGDRLRIQIEQAENQSLIDALTGVANRKAYEERVMAEVNRSQRYKTPLVLGIWDIDLFKRINDQYGHAAGDNALKGVVDRLRGNLRESDFIARYGGEEFVILMPGVGIKDAMQAATKLRQVIADSAFHFRDTSVPITISAGLAECRVGETPSELFDRADSALYRAKEQGRNRCVVAES